MQPVALRRLLTPQYVLALVFVAVLATTSFGVLVRLALLVLTLALLVHGQHAAIRAQHASLRLVLDSTADGLLPIDADGRVRDGSSARIREWFGAPEPGTPFWVLLAGDDVRFATRLEMAFGQVTSGFLPAELALSQMPGRVLKDDVHFELDYQPIAGGEGFLVKVRDVTAELEAEHARKQAMELQSILVRAIRARATYDAFIEETDRLLRQAMDDIPHADRLRVLHTLKGNTAIFGFQSLSECVHEAESTLLEDPDVDVATLVVGLQQAWQANLDRVAEHLDKGDPGVWLTAAEHASHVKALAEETPHRELYATALRWRLEPTVRRLKQLAFSARSTAGSLGKELQVDVDGNWVRLPSRRFAPLWSGLVHVVRNAVDHGIEAPEQRMRCGKPRQGRIDFATRFEEAELVVEIRDDGAGIDWDRLRQRARDNGVADPDPAEPHRLLFVDGLSTMDEVTQLSGRGVGMGALLSVVEGLQGRIVVESERGVGTTFQFRFPLHSIPELGEQRSAA